MRHTKIIATVGPASAADDVLEALIAAGTDIFRLNFSHGTQQTQADTFARVRAAAARSRREVAILQDLAGPKIRTGTNRGGRPIPVKSGERLAIGTGDFPGEPGRLSTTFAGLARSVRPGDRLLLADGSIELRVDATDGETIQTTAIEGGEIGEHKGINAPGVPLPASAITPKDADDLRFGLSLGVDMVAVGFVQTAADLRQARQLMSEAGAPDVPVVAKLERPQALEHLDEILAASDAVMVARGDLGVDMPTQRRAADDGRPQDHAQALCEAAVTLANRGDAQAIVAVTRGGGTARRLSALRPRAPIFATTDHDSTARRLALYWGVMPVCTDIGENVDSAGTLIGQQLVARGLVPSGASVVLVSISPDLTRGDANFLKIKRL